VQNNTPKIINRKKKEFVEYLTTLFCGWCCTNFHEKLVKEIKTLTLFLTVA